MTKGAFLGQNENLQGRALQIDYRLQCSIKSLNFKNDISQEVIFVFLKVRRSKWYGREGKKMGSIILFRTESFSYLGAACPGTLAEFCSPNLMNTHGAA